MLRVLLATCCWIMAVVAAAAFGTEPAERGVGAEHERITRAAVDGLGPKTLDRLVQAVDAPDGGGQRAHATVHCDGGDYLPPEHTGGEAYAQTRETAQAALDACRDFIFAKLAHAVAAAKPLADPKPADVALDCADAEANGSVKCDVFVHLGMALHAAQDFYARTNWVDRAGAGPVSADNPPGLGKTGRALWLDPRKSREPFPEGLISGCPGDFSIEGATFGCGYGDWVPLLARRVLVADLSKDTGPIGRGGLGGAGMTPRGAINGNFARAVAAALDDTRDKWAYFKGRLVLVYGLDDAAVIMCALERDVLDLAACNARIAHGNRCEFRAANLAPEAGADGAASVEPNAGETAAAEKLYPELRSYCALEESDVTRSRVITGGDAAEARALARARAVKRLALWNACPVEAKAHRASAPPLEPGAKATEVLASRYADCILDAWLRRPNAGR